MSSAADALAAQQVHEHLKAVYTLVQDIEETRQKSEQDIVQLTIQQQGQTNTFSHYQQSKLKGRYKQIVNHTNSEIDLLRKALQHITEIRNIKNERRIQARNAGNKEAIRGGTWMKILLSSAQTLPLFVGKLNEKPPPLCGAIPAESTYIAKPGDMVAALVNISNGDGENWIFAEVVNYIPSTNKYEIDDILAEQNQKNRYILHKRMVIPLPLMRANPETDQQALFRQGAVIMALYPTTSCFYKGIVSKPPLTYNDQYEILFEDSDCPGGYSLPMYVAQRHVIAIKQKIKFT